MLDRREFLKTAAAIAGAMGLTLELPAEEAFDERNKIWWIDRAKCIGLVLFDFVGCEAMTFRLPGLCTIPELWASAIAPIYSRHATVMLAYFEQQLDLLNIAIGNDGYFKWIAAPGSDIFVPAGQRLTIEVDADEKTETAGAIRFYRVAQPAGV